MIPSVLAHQLRRGVEDFLRTTFPISTPFFHGLVDRLLAEKGGVFKGPYLSIQLPFREGKGGRDFFPDVPLRFKPYLHQEEAFRRLAGPRPRSTLVATGTGSGKTESFLFPILDHCYRHRGEPGIKAVLIYPMNALATDQAGRIAKVAWGNPKLRGNLRAGLYVGEKTGTPAQQMGPDTIITDKETLRLNPPDLLLTNYKMLDYLLVRPEDYPIWQHNGAETLRFLVVDEIHTFDGAQGTDLACLVRRLKARLGTPEGHLCCVGTSATLGSEEERDELRAYAADVFGEPFDEGAIVTERRVSAGEFLEDAMVSRVAIPPPERAAVLDPDAYEGRASYVAAQHRAWLGEAIEGPFESGAWRVRLGEALKEHLFFQNLLKALRGAIRSRDELLADLEKVTAELRGAEPTYAALLLDSLLALVSEARVWAPEDPKEAARREGQGRPRPTMPFLHVRVQVWLRELRRMVASVHPEPRIRFSTDLTEEQAALHLPIVHCRECGSTGWAGLKRQNDTQINPSLDDFYRGFFRDEPDPKVTYLFPEEDGRTGDLNGTVAHLCGSCLNLTGQTNPESCPSCAGGELIRVFVPLTRVKRKDRQVGSRSCPFCEAPNGLTVLGSRAASLTSVMISQIYASSFNDDKKLLTFSDSVQDAAHRAGFFGARTYRFNLRGALQQFILDGGEGLTLAELPDRFVDHWSRALDDENAFIATFLAPNMTWFEEFETLRREGKLPESASLWRDVRRRIGWEIISEYGFSARIGRTLEKTGSSIAGVDAERLERAVGRLLEPLRNEVGVLRGLDEGTLRRFLLGLLTQMRTQGAIVQDGLGTYLEGWGNTYVLNKIPWMPSFGRFSRAPAFLTTKAGTRFDQLLSRGRSQRTWYESWAEKCLTPVSPLVSEVLETVYRLVVEGLVAEGVLEARDIKGDRVWGLRPEALRVTREVALFKCNRCGHNASAASAEEASWLGAPCLRFRCSGHYEREPARPDYYAKLYAAGDIARIFAEEHTGLLTREEREEVERAFKAGAQDRKPWYPNLLSCTPTLEMGIDIGDLSSLILCSVPPAQANYLQRIGRAGRRDGNALNVTVANGRPHDLFYFAEPEEMLAGRVEPPGVFLDASAVLERQFTAFSFDRWVESGIGPGALPRRMGQVLNHLEPADPKRFPYNLLWFIETHQTELFDRFTALFGEALSDESVEELRAFVDGDREDKPSVRYRIVEGLHDLRRQRDSLRKKVRTLHQKIKKKQADPAADRNTADEIAELMREKSALQALVRNISDRDVFNFFTDEGLLPNYAFPEAGVVLRSVIYRRREKAKVGGRRYDTRVYEYERPAASAIAELAPENTFYAGGRKVRVDQVDMAVSEVEDWRFCDDCCHAELVGAGEDTAACPRCGSDMWSDAGQRRPMLRMRQVFANTSDRESRIHDDSDDREPAFYNRQTLVDFDEHDIRDAYRADTDAFPFGFEFLAKATLREINFGEKDEFADPVRIAGVELPRKGFVVCRHCGKVQTRTGQVEHAWTCTARDQDAKKNLTDCIYLYRDFTSEAIRLLLPLTSVADSDTKLHSFVAALHLGLQQKFRGSIDHLQTTLYEEPVADSTFRKKYLVLYDRIPGGTGYLKQLMRSPEPLMEVFEGALQVLRACPCNQDLDKDGCYRCLYAYRHSYHMAETSREAAVQLLCDILEHRQQMVKTDTLSRVPVNVLFDSELEGRFLEALRRARSEALPVELTKELVNGKPGYFLLVGERRWYVEPQVSLGELDGVSVPCKADFVFRPVRPQGGVKPLVVFTDGLLYHKARVGLDTAQRLALVQSGRYRVWSLTWRDVENRYKKQNAYYRDYLDPAGAPGGEKLKPLLRGYGVPGFAKVQKEDSFAWLVRFLADPDEESWRTFAFVNALIRLDPGRFATPDAAAEWRAGAAEILTEEMLEVFDDLDGPRLYGQAQPAEQDLGAPVAAYVAVAQAAVQARDADGVRFGCCLEDGPEVRDEKGFEPVWVGFLRLLNLFQFLPHAYFVTRRGLADGAYDALRLAEVTGAGGTPKAEGTEEDPWEELRELTGGVAHPLIEALAERGLPAPEPGYELAGASGEVVGEAELGWPDRKLAVLLGEQSQWAEVFEAAGWRTVPLVEVLADIEAFLAVLNP